MRAFDKIAGYPREKEELQKLAEIFSNREKYERKGAVLPKGIIFYGPAGTGKRSSPKCWQKNAPWKRSTSVFPILPRRAIFANKSEKLFCRGPKGKPLS